MANVLRDPSSDVPVPNRIPEAEGGIAERVGVMLKNARLEAGLSQKELSLRSGIPKPTLSRYENGHVLPSLATLRRLAAALHVATADLLGEEPSPEARLIANLRDRGVRLQTTGDADRIADLVAEVMTHPRAKAQ